jgi:hypothetical protein
MLKSVDLGLLAWRCQKNPRELPRGEKVGWWRKSSAEHVRRRPLNYTVSRKGQEIVEMQNFARAEGSLV